MKRTDSFANTEFCDQTSKAQGEIQRLHKHILVEENPINHIINCKIIVSPVWGWTRILPPLLPGDSLKKIHSMMVVMMVMKVVIPWKHTCHEEEDEILRWKHIPVIMAIIVSLYCVYTRLTMAPILQVFIMSVYSSNIGSTTRSFIKNLNIVIKEKLGP